MLIARQIPPEHQSPDEFYEDINSGFYNVILKGNRDFRPHTTPIWDTIEKHWDYLCLDYENGEDAAKLLNDYFGGSFTPDDARELCRIMSQPDRYYERGDYMLDMLNLVTHEKWNCRIICGCCQSDWQKLYYKADEWTKESLDTFETLYFNEGTEWIVDLDGDNVSYYSCNWDPDDIRAELVREFGDDEIRLEKFVYWQRIPIYRDA